MTRITDMRGDLKRESSGSSHHLQRSIVTAPLQAAQLVYV